ncbi:hypothetical protein EON65_17625 [archaeon]|nr:MAG: hypothetical protein EON65_17625 [archaeon]
MSGNRIRKVFPDGTITTIAGIGARVCSSASFYNAVVATSVPSCSPSTLAIVPTHKLYFVGTSFCVIELTLSSGLLNLISGSETTAYVDGTGLANARFASITSLFAVDQLVYVTESVGRVRVLNFAQDIVSTIAGSPGGTFGDNLPGTSTSLNRILSSCSAFDGRLYLAEEAVFKVRSIFLSSTNTLSTFLGNGSLAVGAEDMVVKDFPTNRTTSCSYNSVSSHLGCPAILIRLVPRLVCRHQGSRKLL